MKVLCADAARATLDFVHNLLALREISCLDCPAELFGDDVILF